MTLQDLARLGEVMRAAQRAYFRSRSPADLDRTKRLEQQFDLVCKDVRRQPTLFDREQTS